MIRRNLLAKLYCLATDLPSVSLAVLDTSNYKVLVL